MTAGQRYLFVLRQRDLGNTGTNLQMAAHVAGWPDFHDYPGGTRLIARGTYPYSGSEWLDFAQGADVGFTATFLPESAAGAFAALLVMSLVRRRRR